MNMIYCPYLTKQKMAISDLFLSFIYEIQMLRVLTSKNLYP